MSPNLRALRWGATAALLCLALPVSADLDLDNCTLKGARGYGTVQALCGVMTRPENPAEPEGETIDIAVARIPSLSPNPLPDAVTVINGGPGGSSIEMYADMASIFQLVLRERDIIVIDQRGTGESHPMSCPDVETVSNDIEFSEAVVQTAVTECLGQLNGDPRYYSTSVAVQDLEALRVALGYEQLNLYGVSYGSRVAIHYLRKYPQATRSVIIDGVLPPAHALGTRVSINAQNVLDSVFERCGNDPACAEAFPDLESQFDTLSEHLKANPQAMAIANPVTGQTEQFTLEYGHLAVALRLLNYAPETAAMVPVMISQAANEQNYLPIASNAIRIIERLGKSINNVMHNAVVCTEDTPFYSDDNLHWTAVRETFLGEEQVQVLITMCDIWPKGVLDDDFHDDITTDVPVLLLSGEFDPITPPEYAERVDATLPNSRHIVAPGQGHGVIMRGCIPRLASEFIEETNLTTLDPSCVERMAPSPFFVNLMGPPP